MQKRILREKREFLYRKANQVTDKDTPSLNVSSAPETGNIDDEYALQLTPKILVTTSRDPSSRLVQFAKEMKLMLPLSQRMNRGNHVLKDIVDACHKANATDLVVFHETRGQPDGMTVSHLPHGPTCYFSLANVVLRHDIPDRGTVSEQYPHLIFDNFSSSLGTRIQTILKALFPPPKQDAKRVMTFSNKSDFISFRHHVFAQVDENVQLVEVGPRFEMRAYEIKRGTLDDSHAETEWVYRPYQRTARKRDLL